MEQTSSKFNYSPQTVRYQNIIELIESDAIIRDLFTKMSGLAIQTYQGQKVFVRERYPQFTHEFISDFILKFRFISNPVTAQTDWDKNEIKSHLRDMCASLLELLGTKGDDNYISEFDWQEITNIHFEGLKKTNSNSKFKPKSGWNTILNRNWTIDDPVNRQMLIHVKIKGADHDQFIVMRDLFWEIYPFLDGSLRRSMDALTLKHHQEVIKETHTQQEMKRKSGFNPFGKMMGQQPPQEGQ